MPPLDQAMACPLIGAKVEARPPPVAGRELKLHGPALVMNGSECELHGLKLADQERKGEEVDVLGQREMSAAAEGLKTKLLAVRGRSSARLLPAGHR